MWIRLRDGFPCFSFRPAGCQSARPLVEALESRTLPATIQFDFGFPVPFFDGNVPTTGVALQADGKIVQVGSLLPSADGGNSQFVVVRYNTNGTLDSTFGNDPQHPGTIVVPFFNSTGGFTHTDRAWAVAIQPDQRIVVAGEATVANGDQDFGVVRLDSSGHLDTTFGPSHNGYATVAFNLAGSDNLDRALAVAIQPADNKIVLAGEADSSNNGKVMAAARLNTDGTPDTTGFGTNGITTVPFNLVAGSTDVAQAVGIQSTGQIVLGGYAQTGANSYDLAAARLKTDGTLDSTGPNAFNGNGKATVSFSAGGLPDDRAFALAIQSDDAIVLVGQAASSSTSEVAVVRLMANGSVGNQNVIATAAAAFAVALQPGTGNILLAADAPSGPPVVMRLNPDLSPDATFNGTGIFIVDVTPYNQPSSFAGFATHADAIAVQADGQLVIVGTGQETSPTPGQGGFVTRLIEVVPTIPPIIPPVVTPLLAYITGASVKLNPLRPAASKVRLTFHGTLRIRPGAFELHWGSLNIKLNVVVSATADGTAVDLSLKLPRGKVPRGRTVTVITHGSLITLPDGTLFDAAGNGVPGSTRKDVFTVPLKRSKGR
jgi:uncharacterized delta-60 repeat protein